MASTPDRDSRRESLKTRSLREKLDEVKQLVNLSASLRIRVNNRSSAPQTLRDRPSVIGVFQQQHKGNREAEESPTKTGGDELEFLREDNRRLTEDFQEALDVIRRISEAREADAVMHQPAEVLLEQLEKERAENVRLRVKINAMLSDMIQVAHMGDTTSDDETQELRINENTIL